MTLSPRALVKSIDENTSVPLKIVLPIMAAVVGGILWISTQMADMRTSIARIETKVDLVIGARAQK